MTTHGFTTGQNFNLNAPTILGSTAQTQVNPQAADSNAYIEAQNSAPSQAQPYSVVSSGVSYPPTVQPDTQISGIPSYVGQPESVPLTYPGSYAYSPVPQQFAPGPPQFVPIPPPQPEKPFWKKYLVVIIIAGVLVIGAIIGVIVYVTVQANRPRSLGSTCSTSSQCSRYCGSGLCGGNGATCYSSSDCINSCVNGYCSSSSSSSGSGSYRSNGSSCSATSQCLNFCSPGGICGGYGALCLSSSDCVRFCVGGYCN
ncbi:hypothetical protein HK098_003661 [Nowakowskiella sp. JEL0407]|nr:hypothetical protein HK098_003661 [Nowakowskiella sp. JEL0407]